MADVLGTREFDQAPTVNGNRVLTVADVLDSLQNVSVAAPTIGDVLQWDGTNWVAGTSGGSSLRPTYCIWAEENADVNVAANNYEYSFGNGAANTTADPPGIPIGVPSTLIGIGVAARATSTTIGSLSISVTRNGVVVATGNVATSTGVTNERVSDHTIITPDTIDFAVNDNVQFLTASRSGGGMDDVRVTAWFERTA